LCSPVGLFLAFFQGISVVNQIFHSANKWLVEKDLISRMTFIIPIDERSELMRTLMDEGWNIVEANCPINPEAKEMAIDITRFRIVAEKLQE
jgi:hypothetical protein